MQPIFRILSPRIWITWLLVLVAVCAQAQVSVTLSADAVNPSPAQWLDLTLQVPPGMPSSAIIRASLHQNGAEVWTGVSVPFRLGQGMMQIRRGQLAWASQSGGRPAEGASVFCMEIVGDPGGQYLGEGCTQLDIHSQGADPGSDSKEPGSQHSPGESLLSKFSSPSLTDLRPSGSIEVYGQADNQPLPLTEFPSRYAGVQGYTQLQAFGLPLRADVNWISGPEARQFGWNQITFSLDPLALRDSLRQQIASASQAEPAKWSNTWETLRQEKVQAFTSKYELPITGLGDSLLSHQINRGQTVGRMKTLLSGPALGKVKESWQQRLGEAGLTNEQQIGQYLDSLSAVDPTAYEDWLKQYSRLGQVEAIEEKIKTYESDSTWLPDWQKWEQKKADVEAWKEADPEELLQDPQTLKALARQKKSWQWMASLERFQVGSIFPQENSLSFQGTPES